MTRRTQPPMASLTRVRRHPRGQSPTVNRLGDCQNSRLPQASESLIIEADPFPILVLSGPR